MKIDPMETNDTLITIVHLQADIIKDLFGILMQHITAEEADNLPVVARINTAAGLFDGLNRQEH